MYVPGMYVYGTAVRSAAAAAGLGKDKKVIINENIPRTSAACSTNFWPILIFESCVVGTCNILRRFIQSDWSLSCDHGLDYASERENNISTYTYVLGTRGKFDGVAAA